MQEVFEEEGAPAVGEPGSNPDSTDFVGDFESFQRANGLMDTRYC